MKRELAEKAGAFVLTKGTMVFMLGPTADKSALAIVRLGGHREGNETAWECAQREVYEESRMRISPFTPTMTFHCLNSELDTVSIEPIAAYQNIVGEPRPLITGYQNTIQSTTPIFLTSSDDEPVPNMETKALLRLTRRDVIRLCSEHITLEDFQSSGGVVIFGEQMDGRLPLKPFVQLLMLSIILEQYPDVIPRSMFP